MIEHTNDMIGYLTALQSIPHPTPAVVSQHDLVVLAADEVNTKGAMAWIKENVLGLIFLACASVAGVGALRSNAGKVITILALVMVCLLLAAIAGSAATQQTMMQFLLGLIGL